MPLEDSSIVETSVRYSYANEQYIIDDLVTRLGVGTQYAIDIAAGDGRHMSNTLALFERGWAGLAVECDGDRFAQLAHRYSRFDSVGLARCRVTPATVCSLLTAHGTPHLPGVLNLDIDSYDHAVLEALLTTYRTHIICAEINEKIPPPIRFTVLYDPAHQCATDHFYGQSISQLYRLAQHFGYGIVTLEFNNAFLVPLEILVRAGLSGLTDVDAYRAGYRDRPERHYMFPWNANLEHLQSLSPAAAVTELQHHFAAYAGKFRCEI